MTSNVRMIIRNDADAAVLTASPAMEATLPVTHLQDPSRARVAQTTGLATQEIKGAWSAPKGVSGCVLARHNLTSSGTWRLQVYSDAAWTTQVYDSGAVVSWPAKSLGDIEWGIDPLGATVFTGWGQAFSSLWFPPVTGQSFKITLADPTNPDGYLRAARLFMGSYTQPLFNFSYGVSLGWKEDTQQTRTDGGTLRSDAREPYRILRFSCKWLSETDRPKFLDIGRTVGMRKDIFVSCFPGAAGMKERDYAMPAKLVRPVEHDHNFVGNYIEEFELEEA